MTIRDKLLLARRLFSEGSSEKAMKLMCEVPADYPLSSTDLIIKARLIQVTECGAFTLEDAEKCLRDAMQQDPSNVYVLIELAFFESRVLGLEADAEAKFVRAMTMLSDELKECAEGLLEVRGVDQSDPRYHEMLNALLHIK